MLFSVIVPIYKTEKYLTQCVDSILSQSFSDFELILVDDGSPDNCPRMVDEIAEKDKRVIAVHKKNGGLVSARKAGMAQAHGDYILNIDSDDFVGKDFLLDISERIKETQAQAVFFGFTLYTETDSGLVTSVRLNSSDIGIYKDQDCEKIKNAYLYDSTQPEMNGGSVLFNICCKAIKRELYLKSQSAVPDEVVSGEDTLFTMNLLTEAASIDICGICSYYYRQNPQSIEHTVSPKDFTNLLFVFNEMQKLCESNPCYENSVYVYLLSRLWTFTIRNAKCAESPRIFRKRLSDENYKKLSKYSRKAVVAQKKLTERVLIFALKHQLYLFIYILGKTWFKGKDF